MQKRFRTAKVATWASILTVAMGLGVLSQSVKSAFAAAPYKIIAVTQTNGTGLMNPITADSDGRRLYVPRGDHILVFDLDSYKCVGSIPGAGAGGIMSPTGEILSGPGAGTIPGTRSAAASLVANFAGYGIAVDPKTHHGFAASNPVLMFDTSTLQPIKKIADDDSPHGILFEPATERIYVLSGHAQTVTVIDPNDSSVGGTIDVGGFPDRGLSDSNGRVFISLTGNEGKIAVVDARTMKLVDTYSFQGRGSPRGFGIDAANHILFAMCSASRCVILNSDNGKIITALPLTGESFGGGFNPATMEAFSSQADGTLTIIKENSPTNFVVEQTLQTKPGARYCALDTKTGHIIVTATENTSTRVNQPLVSWGPGLLDVIVVGR